MFRNKEVRLFIGGMSILTIVAVLVSYFHSPHIALIVGLVGILSISLAYFFSLWRYREIEQLSTYLRKISNGDFYLDVRDNDEGELSILKNEIYKVTNILAEHKALLQADKKHLTDAISDISHQLKTPLTSMKMTVDFLRVDQLSDEKRFEFTYTMKVQVERIEWLVAALLKLSKIDAGTARFNKERIVVKSLIQQAAEALVVPMDIKEQFLSIEGKEDVHFIGDFNWTVEAIVNLLKNGVEHTPNGGRINVHFKENALYTEIIIADSGSGIPKEDVPYIFKRFYKGKNATEDSVGIGLALAYSIVTEQNGDIHVKSDSKNGTTFAVKFYKQR